MKVLLSYEENGENMVDGPYLSYKEIAAAIDGLTKRGVVDCGMHRIDAVCDFCSHPGITAIFKIKPGSAMVDEVSAQVDSDGKWGACAICENFIRKGDPVPVLQRAVENARRLYPDEYGRLPVVVVAQMLAIPHSIFWLGWDGSDPEPVISDEELLGGE